MYAGDITANMRPSGGTWQTGVGFGPHLTADHSARQDMRQVTLYSKTYCQVLCKILYISYLVRWLIFQCDIS